MTGKLILDGVEDMPKVCAYCPLCNINKSFCKELKSNLIFDISKKRYSKCPLKIKS